MMISPRTLPALISRRSHLSRDEQVVAERPLGSLSSLLEAAIETQNWTLVNLCAEKLRKVKR